MITASALIFVVVGFIPNVGIDGDESGAIVFNEFMSHPLASVTETEGEWIELYNRSGDWVNLSCWRIVNHSGEEIILNSYLLPPESFFVAGASGDESRNGGYTPDCVYGSFSIDDTDELTLYSRTGVTSDHIDFNGTWDIIPGHSCERMNPGWVSNLASSWAHAILSFGAGDQGTPGFLNSVFQNSFAQNTWAFIKAFSQ
jgi:hypothetical protein